MLQIYDVYGDYGFYDSLQIRGRVVSYQYLALDQAMILISLTNYLNDNSIQRLLEQDPIGKRIKALLRDEEFF